MNILFLSVSAGGGHLKASEAVKEYIEANYDNSSAYIVDAYKYVSPILDKLLIGGYLKTLKNSPKLWGKIYELAEKGENVTDLSQTLNKILSFKIKRLIKEYSPDVIVCTHPFPLQMVCNLKKHDKINIPIVTIITDYATHSQWINEYVDAYIVANEELLFEMKERNIEKNKVFSFGIPIKNKFLKKYDKVEVLNNFGLTVKPTILIMGGSLGMNEIKKLFLNLLKTNQDIQIIIIAGKDEHLKKQLEKIYLKSKSNKKSIILGFTDKVAELMSVADLLITKPGGLTTAEALNMNLPILIFSPIPGQEEKNSRFLLNNGVGMRLDNIEHADRMISQFFYNELRLKHIKEMSTYLAKPNASKDIAHLLFNISQKSSL